MTRRTAVKWLHWICAALILWFFLFEPETDRGDPAAGLSVHAGMGLILGVAAAIWFAMFLAKGPMNRPGPKLPDWAKRVHKIKHRVLYIGVPVMVATGAFAGLAAPYLIRAFGVVPINFASGSLTLHEFAEEVHEVVFNALILVVVVHVIFHLWRHFGLKDNALRLILPNRWHRFL